MASEWPTDRLGSHCAKIGSGATPRGGKSAYLPSGKYSLIRSQNVYNDGFNPSGLAYISPEQARLLDSVAIEANDVLVNITGDSVARVCLAPTWVLPARVNQHVAIVRPKPDSFDSRYLRYFLTSPSQQEHLLSLASVGATRNALTKGMLESFRLPIPPLAFQTACADVLEALDDRIDLLRQTNATLEAIAQALFKSWFVDFDPVRAKAEGREPEGMDPATAALFPSEFEETELGLIPKGWSTASFGSVAQQCKGTVNPLQFPTTEFDHYSLPAFDAGRTPSIELGETIKSNKTPVPSNAVLISKLNPHIPRIWFVGDAKPGAVCSTEFLVWRPTTGLPAEYVYCLSSSPAFNSAMKQLVTGTSNSHQRVKPDHLNSIPVIAPPSAIAVLFGNIAGPILRRVLQNLERANTLATLRDTLLPRLISGKLRLTEPDFQVAKSSA